MPQFQHGKFDEEVRKDLLHREGAGLKTRMKPMWLLVSDFSALSRTLGETELKSQ